jgi:hypothetical protein
MQINKSDLILALYEIYKEFKESPETYDMPDDPMTDAKATAQRIFEIAQNNKPF